MPTEIDYPDDAPDLLYVMRLVSVGQAPGTPFGKGLDDWMKAKPIAFMEKLAGLELEYWSVKKPEGVAAGPQAKPKDGEVCPTCGEVYWSPGCERGLEAGRSWLEANRTN